MRVEKVEKTVVVDEKPIFRDGGEMNQPDKDVAVQTPPVRGRLVKAAEAKERNAAVDEIPPGLRELLMRMRAARLMEADEIADYLGLAKRRRDFD